MGRGSDSGIVSSMASTPWSVGIDVHRSGAGAPAGGKTCG
jgi:hypothetical protein